MAARRAGIHHDCIHFDLFLIGRDGTGIDSLAVEVRIAVRIYDDARVLLLHGNIK